MKNLSVGKLHFNIGPALPALREASDRRGLVVVDLEHRIQLGDLQQVLHALIQPQQLQLSAMVGYGGEAGDKLADTGAVYISDVAQVQQQLLMSGRGQVANGIAEGA